MRIAMIGTGYVGLVSGACFSDFGHQVTCVDKDAGKIAALQKGDIPIYEPGLDALVFSNVRAKRLDFTTDLSGPVAEADTGVVPCQLVDRARGGCLKLLLRIINDVRSGTFVVIER